MLNFEYSLTIKLQGSQKRYPVLELNCQDIIDNEWWSTCPLDGDDCCMSLILWERGVLSDPLYNVPSLTMLSTRLMTGLTLVSCSSSSQVCCLSSRLGCWPMFLMLSCSALHASIDSHRLAACRLNWIKIKTNSSWLLFSKSPAVMLARFPPNF